ncbi:hypothetical protein [Streptomyces acidicola]|uniref:Uncharacterized protein n=1 Tax=Streptomyces acidicola TaxID=2596892 RepID=A0A5N8WKU4_9ACTN|nr:hypothetical protein [Streptomyces acidicola]MPY47456.1 hypothetical protein [Streptomyces acidicola]
MISAVQALAWAGAADRVADILQAPSREGGLRRGYEKDRARMEAAAGLWPYDPELAGRLVDDVLDGVHSDPCRTSYHCSLL